MQPGDRQTSIIPLREACDSASKKSSVLTWACEQVLPKVKEKSCACTKENEERGIFVISLLCSQCPKTHAEQGQADTERRARQIADARMKIHIFEFHQQH